MQGSMIEKQPTFKPVAVTITIENAKELEILKDFMLCNMSVPADYCVRQSKDDQEVKLVISNFMEIFGNLIHNV